ncbi:MAG: hypothetical protein M3Y41_21820, partial [Pseudomonadota bacterium]|nr:hypothetical protein [Pseudomonadota bacterium]
MLASNPASTVNQILRRFGIPRFSPERTCSRIIDDIRRLRSALPNADRSADDLDERNRELRPLIDEEKLTYESHRSKFEAALAASQAQVTQSQTRVATAFARYANEFLKERCKIAFQPVNVRIGQTGGEFEVGLFQLSISGGGLGGETPRTERPFRNHGGTVGGRGWMVGADVIPSRCSKPCRRHHVDPDRP